MLRVSREGPPMSQLREESSSEGAVVFGLMEKENSLGGKWFWGMAVEKMKLGDRKPREGR